MKMKFIRLIAALVSVMLLTAGCAAGNVSAGKNAEYVFFAVDEDKRVVPGVSFQVCTDKMCQLLETDENGKAVFEGEPAAYEVHVAKYPDGYYYDTEEVYVTKTESETVSFVLKKADAEQASGQEAAKTEESTVPSDIDNGYAEKFPYLAPICKVQPSDDKVSFTGIDMDGNTVDESVFADYDLTLVNLWEPWCGPCCNEMPIFQQACELAREAGIKFNVVGLYVTEENAKETVDQLGITYTVARTEDHIPEFSTPYIPVNFFVNREGYVLPVSFDEYKQIYMTDIMAGLEAYRAGDYEADYEEYYRTLDELDKAGTLEQELTLRIRNSVYSKGQINSLDQYMLFQLIADRLP